MIKFKALTFIILILIAFGFLFFVLSMQISSTPKFCGSCHIMIPYYQSWLTSSHNKIACVDCHIPPGLASEFRKKYEALSMIARYITGTYGTNPWAEVEDSACLKCHERRLLAGTEIFHNVLFDHKIHLTELRRKKKLRCTSCHSQIVQGSHIAVTESTCFLCHFKNQKLNEDTARCSLCHEVPEKIITKANLEFNHSDVKKFGMECIWCHSQIVRGNGEVPQERCYTCHNEPHRLEKYKKTEYLHIKHVSEHKVECLNCHMEIIHKSEEKLESISTSCSTCHYSGHPYQSDLYIGIAGKETKPSPSIMFAAGVKCEGCHFLPSKKKHSIAEANEISCMACHGASYRKIYFSWQSFIQNKINKVESLLNLALSKIPKKDFRFKEAEENLNMVKIGKGIHNIDYSSQLLNKSIELINEVLEENNLSSYKLLTEEEPYNISCWKCHKGIEYSQTIALKIPFSHFVHIYKNKILCTTCHNEHSNGNFKMKIKAKYSECKNCHHKSVSEEKCKKCHSSVLKETISYENKAFLHSLHYGDLELNCLKCHNLMPTPSLNKQLCKECH